MDREGKYRKDRGRITDPITRVKGNLPEAARSASALKALSEGTAGVVVVDRTTGWLIAALLLSLIAGVVYGVREFFTRAHQLDTMDSQLRYQRNRIENLESKNQDLAKRLILMETELEKVQERGQ